MGEFYWAGGLGLDPAGSGGIGSALGQVELDQGVGLGSGENQLVFCPYNPAAFGGKAFSTSAFYTLSYTINTTTGQISNVSLSDGTYTDTADYQTIDNFNNTASGPNGAIFTVANTAFAGLINGSAGTGTAQYMNFQLSGGSGGTVPSGSNWTGGNSTTNWADAGNWNGAVPGATTGTTNTDTAVFNQTVSFQPTTIDMGRNVQNIVFDTANVSAMTVGTTTGNSLLLTSGGAIQTTATVTAAQTVNAPLVLEGVYGLYTFTSNATSSTATLSFGGGITAGGSSGTTLLTLNGSNTGANTDQRHHRQRFVGRYVGFSGRARGQLDPLQCQHVHRFDQCREWNAERRKRLIGCYAHRDYRRLDDPVHFHRQPHDFGLLRINGGEFRRHHRQPRDFGQRRHVLGRQRCDRGECRDRGHGRNLRGPAGFQQPFDRLQYVRHGWSDPLAQFRRCVQHG